MQSERVLTAAQTITVTVSDKDDEAPGQPAVPTIAEATMNSLKVTWEVPANAGPEITDYDVQYKASDDDGFTDAEYDGTDLTLTLTNLKSGTSYEVQVRAKNDEGTGAWSDSGSGMTIENQAPVFTSNATFEVKENNTTVGTVSANDEDSDDSITGYAITGGVDQEQFEITEEGGLRFKASPNYEVPADVESADPANAANNNEYIVEVTATGGASERVLTAKQTLTVTVSDKDDEAPGQVETPVVSEATMNSLKVTWAVPANAGPEITDYDVQYKASDDDGFTAAEYDGTDLTLTLTGLKSGTSYEVQVRATSDEGTGVWSDSGEGKMKVNVAPVFTSNATFNVLENVTGVGIVVANDADSDDSVTSYAITGGADQTQFSIFSETGVLIFKAAPDFEAPLDVNIDNAYIVEVTATSGENGRALTATQTITVIVTDIGPPEIDAPTVTQATATTLTITWENTSVVLNTDNVSIFDPIDVALDIAGNKLYWTDSGSIRRADLDGTNVEDVIRDAVQFPVGIALDIAGNKMYWVDLYSNKVQRADLNGENIEDLVTTGQDKPGGIALDIARNKMYWMDSGSIRRADLDGENVEDLIATGLPDKFGGIALDIVGNKMYWAIGDRIRRADLDGTNVEDLVTTGLVDPFDIALDIAGNKLYWADRGTDKVQRADLNGRNVEDLVTTGLDDPFGIALDIARNKLYWTETGIRSKKIGRIDLDLNYDIQYRIIDTTGFISANYTGEDLTTTLTDLAGTCEVQVRATNAEGTGDWSPSIQVLMNQYPEFPFGNVRWTVRNHSTRSSDFDTDVSAHDNDPLTYTLIGEGADDFIFDPSTGRIQLKSGLSFDRDVKEHYEFFLVATDGKGGHDTLIVRIHVSEYPNDPPYYDTYLQPLPIVLRLYNQRFRTNTDLSTVFKDDNDDSDSFRYSLSGRDHHMFRVDQETGQLSIAPSYDNYFSGDFGNEGAVHPFKLHVSDGHGGTAEVPVHVYVSRNKTTESFRTFVNWRAWNGGSRQAEPDYSMVPDFSYAGYHYFEKPIPELTERNHPIFDVTTYGAIANDVYSDQPAIERAIEAAEAAGGGTIFFPEGEYLVATQTDLIDGEPQPIKIQGSNIVFKGVGADTNIRYSDRDNGLVWSSDVPETIEWGSIIRQVYNLESVDGSNDGTPALFQFIPSDTTSHEITTIVEKARTEDFWITVADASQLRVEQRVVLCMFERDWDDFIDNLTTAKSSKDWTSGMKVYERHQIAEIRGNRVRFKEPLHFFLIEPEHGWSVRTYPHIEEVGVEDLSIQGTWRHSFVHHASPKHDSGYTPLKFEKCVNSWVRRVNFVNVNIGMLIYRCMAVSVYQVRLAGSRGHFFIKNKKNYGVFIGLTEDRGGSKYGSPDRKGQEHGSNVQSSTTGTVHWRNDMHGNQKIDPHASCPYANLFDSNNGGQISGAGNIKSMPNHLFSFVCWNHAHQRSAHRDYHFWSSDDRSWILRPIFVGYHRGEYGGTFEMQYAHINESEGTKVNPSSLFQEQLKLRLGRRAPSWLNDLAGEWEDIKARDIWVPPILIKKSLKLNFEKQEFDDGVKILDLSSFFRKMYNVSHSEYTATSSNPDIATVQIFDIGAGNDGDLKLRRRSSGSVTITVEARAVLYTNNDGYIFSPHTCPIPARQTFILDID